jgi:hypothetical protein
MIAPRILQAAPPNESHSNSVIKFAVEHTQRQIESVCRHYVEHQSELGLATGDAEILLQLGFDLRVLTGRNRTKLLMHPTTQYWLAAMRRASGPADAEKRVEFAQDASTLDLQVALSIEQNASKAVILDDEGGLRLPLFDRHIEFGPSKSRQWVEIETSPDEVRFAFADGMRINVPTSDVTGSVTEPFPDIIRDGFAITVYPTLLDGQIQVQRRDHWLRPHWTGTNERTTGTIFFGACEKQYPEQFNIGIFQDAMDIIANASIHLAQDVATFTSVLVPRFTGPDQRIGFTVLSRQGAMFLDPDAPDIMAENIIHENAHVKLRYMQLADPILEDFYTSDGERYSVPWRPDPRPLPGILEGAYVFSNVLELRRQTQKIVGPHKNLKRDVDGAIELLSQHGKFTAGGRAFLQGLKNWHHTASANA